jgi:polyphosphate kinase 2 (PPK2 family)
MLENIDLSRKLEKRDYKRQISRLQIKLGELQRLAREAGLPVIIVFEGWDAAGKGTLINKLLLALDPRGYNVFPTFAPNEEEHLRPFLWRFWIKTPSAGKFAIFDRSWYRRLITDRVEGITDKKQMPRDLGDILSFERQLSDNGTLIIKFFLHISKKEQKKRFGHLEENKATSWKVTSDDWRHHAQYSQYLKATNDALDRTDTAFAPWTAVESHDSRFAAVKVFSTVCKALEKALKPAKTSNVVLRCANARAEKRAVSMPAILSSVDLSVKIDRNEYRSLLEKYQERIMELEHEAYKKRIPVIIVYEGWDAAGKGGNIRRLVQGMDPRGYEVIPIAAPNDVEKSHCYLWRFWNHMPKAGHIAIFDRSWYGRCMVERVEGFCTGEEWNRSFAEINEMEAHLTGFGAVIIKFWLHIDKNEQLRRFRERELIEHKKWKITNEDWRNRKKWNEYGRAVNEMLYQTGTKAAPWTVIEANDKYYARIKALTTVINRIEEQL